MKNRKGRGMTRSRDGRQLDVLLHDRIVGHLFRRENLTRFVFAPDYWDDPARPVLGLRFEEDRRAHHQANMRLPPWFSNLLPEGRLRDWISRMGGAPLEAEAELLVRVGHDLPGAVRVLPSERSTGIDPSWEGAEPATPGSTDGLWRFSLAGVMLKFSLLAQGERLIIPAIGEAGDWILKLPDPRYPDLPFNELAMMRLAAAAGIEIPEARLVHRDEVQPLPEPVWAGTEPWAYAVRRFDRGPRRELIHIEDLAQVRGCYPEQKYQGSFDTVASLVHRRRDRDALRELARRLCFNILIGNGDAHLKNWSLIYPDRRTPTLAPAYDLVATFPYRPPAEGPEALALRLGGTKQFAAVRFSGFDRLDARLGADADLGDVARDLTQRVLAAWPVAESVLKRAGDPSLSTKIAAWMHAQAARLARG
jgi:serine/threonine-protein kinase HipA